MHSSNYYKNKVKYTITLFYCNFDYYVAERVHNKTQNRTPKINIFDVINLRSKYIPNYGNSKNNNNFDLNFKIWMKKHSF